VGFEGREELKRQRLDLEIACEKLPLSWHHQLPSWEGGCPPA